MQPPHNHRPHNSTKQFTNRLTTQRRLLVTADTHMHNGDEDMAMHKIAMASAVAGGGALVWMVLQLSIGLTRRQGHDDA